MKKTALLPILVLGAVLVLIQLAATAAQREFYLTQLIMSAYYAIVVLGLCLVMGFAGQISMGHGAFFAIGGYTSAILTTRHMAFADSNAWGEWGRRLGLLVARQDLYGGNILTASPWAAFAVAMALTAAVAILIGYPSLRLKGHYLAMATLGFGLIVYRIVLGTNWTGAADGISGVPPWPLGFGVVIDGTREHRVRNYYVAWSLAFLTLVLLLNVVRSRPGRALRAIHDNELAANAMGVNTSRAKLQAFVLSALLAAWAGCFFTHYTGGVNPAEAGAMKSIRYVVLVAAGGMANLWGALIVSTVLNFLSLRDYFGSLDHAVFGAALIVIVSVAPEGPLQPVAGWIRRVLTRRRSSRSAAHGLA